MVDKPALDLEIKHFFSVHGCGDEWRMEFDIIKLQ